MVRLPLLLCMASALAAAPPLRPQLDRLLEDSPAASRAYWGIHVVDALSGRILYEKNADRFFVPASNMKLFSTALAMLTLGPDHRFTTVVVADGRDLRLIGGGDPTMSARDLPYRKGPVTGDPLRAIDELAAQVKAAGLRTVDGDIIGDDTAWPWEPYPEGWAVDDTVGEDGAPVSALTLNDNRIKLRLRPASAAGLPAILLADPAVPYFFFHNQVRTLAAGPAISIAVDRSPGSREVFLRGGLPATGGGTVEYLAVDDPALYAATALRDALARVGVPVRGRAVAAHRFPGQPPAAHPKPLPVLARRESPPLVETLAVIDKVSQNLLAEMVLRSVALATRGDGSRALALDGMKDFLRELGFARGEYRIEDGSGLTRLTVVSPLMLTTLLRHMYASRHRDQWLALLPVGGEDGTLEKRFNGNPDARRIHAKTGSLSHVAALSGYAFTRSGAPIAFSIVANNYNAPTSEIRSVIDKIAVTVANLE